MNPATKGLVVSSVAGAGVWGAKKLGWVKDEDISAAKSRIVSFKSSFRDLAQTSACATAAGWFQTYSGGIVIDTVATRLQAGQSMSQSLWGLRRATSSPKEVALRHRARVLSRFPTAAPQLYEIYMGMLLRSDLFAGHFVTMLGRFPYLFLNFSTYQQTERLVLRGTFDPLWSTLRRAAVGIGGVKDVDDGHAPKTQRPVVRTRAEKKVYEELLCVSASTLISTAAITVAECPKVIDQVGGDGCTATMGKRSTVLGILREHGARRLLRGYSACFMREYLFNAALLTSPTLAAVIHEKYVRGRRGEAGAEGYLAAALEGREIVVASLLLGLPLGVLTNGPDQLKTNIQTGKFVNMRQAWAWQRKFGGGLRGLYGKAAIYRGLYIAHAVVAFNFARDRVEKWMAKRAGAGAEGEGKDVAEQY